MKNELQLLLQLRSNSENTVVIKKLIYKGIDWQKLTETAIAYRLLPLLYTNIKPLADNELIPEDVIDNLSRLYYSQAIANGHIHEKLCELLNVLETKDISVLVFKGAAIAEEVYGNIALRPMGDIDVLVKQSDLETVKAELLARHYYQDYTYQSDEWYSDCHHHMAPFVNDDGVVIEVHHHVVPLFLQSSFPVDELWSRDRKISIAKSHAKVCSYSDSIILLCLHLSIIDCFYVKLYMVFDIAESILRYEKNLNWSDLLTLIEQYELNKYIYYSFWLTEYLFPGSIPDDVISQLFKKVNASLVEMLILKKIIIISLFRLDNSTQIVPGWFLCRCITILLSNKRGRLKLMLIGKAITAGYINSVKKSTARYKRPLFVYAILLHPVYLMFCKLTNRRD